MLEDKKKAGILALVALALIAVVWVMWPAGARAESLPSKIGLVPVGEVAAASGVNWTGLYLGGGGGYSVGDTGTSLDCVDCRGDSHNLFTLDGLSGDGWQGDVRLGFDWQIGGSPFVVGVLGGYVFGDTETTLSVIDGTARLTGTISPDWYLGGRAGYTFGKTLAYVGYAYQWAEAEGRISAGEFSDGASTSITGHKLLIGMETALAPQFTLGLEYGYTRYEDIDLKAEDCVLGFKPEVHAVMARLNWRPFGK